MKYEIGAKIRYFRELRGLSQKELAIKIGVSNSRVSNWEQGINRPDADILAAICHALEVSADNLLDVKLSTNEMTAEKSEILKKIQKMSSSEVRAVLAFVNTLDSMNKEMGE